MSEPEEPKPRFRVHPLDLLVLVVAVVLGCVAYAYLFRRSPIPRAVDPLLGKVVEIEFAVDRPWKREFPRAGDEALIEDYLRTEVLEAGPAQGKGEDRRVARVRVLERNAQKVEAMTLFRTGVKRGMRVRLTSRDSEVTGEVLDVRPAAETR
jgi:hypothetical protein